LDFSQTLLDQFLEVACRPKLSKYFTTSDLEQLIEIKDEFAVFIKVIK